jgi:hypothetical protein
MDTPQRVCYFEVSDDPRNPGKFLCVSRNKWGSVRRMLIPLHRDAVLSGSQAFVANNPGTHLIVNGLRVDELIIP